MLECEHEKSGRCKVIWVFVGQKSHIRLARCPIGFIWLGIRRAKCVEGQKGEGDRA